MRWHLQRIIRSRKNGQELIGDYKPPPSMIYVRHQTPSPTGAITSSNSATNWGPGIQIPEPILPSTFYSSSHLLTRSTSRRFLTPHHLYQHQHLERKSLNTWACWTCSTFKNHDNASLITYSVECPNKNIHVLDSRIFTYTPVFLNTKLWNFLLTLRVKISHGASFFSSILLLFTV